MNQHELLSVVAKAADDKKAEDIIALNMKGVSPFTDYFIICQANSDKQVQAIAREMKEKVQESGYEIKQIEGFDEGRWVLVDMGEVVAHVFHRDERSYYNLERLWGDVPREDILKEAEQ
ncbi:ribosome silencing factor [Ectobacillus polymachus]|uniref:ribosome silencing factor n=1 Tax=Ectobacillus polymachus TaxID=1508806 RepID=UPI003A892631